MKECKCKTFHTLASDIVSYVTSRNLENVRNMSEFSSTRSSPAFRHAVLVENQLPRTDTHCFDVLEEAYTALIKGFMLPSRRGSRSFDKLLAHDYYLWTSPVSDEDEHLEPSPSRNETASSQTSLSMMSSPRSGSTLTMFDINAEYQENEEFQRQEQVEQQSRRRSMDWLSFVDEQNRNQGTA